MKGVTEMGRRGGCRDDQGCKIWGEKPASKIGGVKGGRQQRKEARVIDAAHAGSRFRRRKTVANPATQWNVGLGKRKKGVFTDR